MAVVFNTFFNRSVRRATLFAKPADYAAFEKILRQGWERLALPLLSYLVMPNHWHLVVWPQQDGVLSTYRRSGVVEPHRGVQRDAPAGEVCEQRGF
jgi:REP element-mobilizing transposase RayT